MTSKVKQSLSIFSNELHLQLVSVSFISIIFILSLLAIRIFSPGAWEMPNMFYAFYLAMIGLVLPWQMHSSGEIKLGYCSYHFNLPVKSWQLYIIPFTSRLLLLLLCASFFYLFYCGIFNGGYYTVKDFWPVFKVIVLLYMGMQFFAWTRSSIANLYAYFLAAFALCLYFKPSIIPELASDHYFPLVIVVLAGLSFVGIRNLRRGTCIRLPFITDIFNLIPSRYIAGMSGYNDAITAQFMVEWKRTWFFMPLMTLLTIMFHCALFLGRNDIIQGGGLIPVMIVLYVFIFISVPLAGIIYITQIGFKSSYKSYMPISSRVIAKVELWCFTGGLSISLALLAIWTSYLGVSSKFHGWDQLYALNSVFMQSPWLIIWLLSVSVIISFIMAYVIATLYLKNAVVSVSIWIAVMFFYLYSRVEIPPLMPLMSGITALVVIKIILLYMNKSSLNRRILFSLAGFAFSLLMVVLCYRFPVLWTVSVVLLMVYPVVALEQYIQDKRAEMARVRVVLPWRYIAFILVVLAVYAIYYNLVSQSINKDLQVVLNKVDLLHIANGYGYKSNSFDAVNKFVKNNLPGGEAEVFKYNKFIEKAYHDNGKRHFYSDIMNYLSMKMTDYINSRKFDKAFKYSLLLLSVKDKYRSFRQLNIYRLQLILRNYSPPKKELDLIMNSMKKIQQDRYLLKTLQLNDSLMIMKKKFEGSTEYARSWEFNRYNILGMEVSPLFMSFFRPMILSFKLDMANGTMKVISAFDYLSGKNKDFNRSLEINPRIINHCMYNNVYIAHMQNVIVYTAMMQFRNKYGKFPTDLNALVPEFLGERDLYSTRYISNNRNTGFKAKTILVKLSRDDIIQL